MLKLNLLPPKEKKELELIELNRSIYSFAFRFLIILVIFALLFVAIHFSLSILLKAQNNLIEIIENDQRTQRLAALEERIKQVNQYLDQIYKKQSQIIIWTPILEELSSITSSGLYLDNFSYQSSLGKISLNGWANNRDKLLVFQESLEQSPYFEKVEAPLSNLIKQTDINFSFSLYLKNN